MSETTRENLGNVLKKLSDEVAELATTVSDIAVDKLENLRLPPVPKDSKVTGPISSQAWPPFHEGIAANLLAIKRNLLIIREQIEAVEV